MSHCGACQWMLQEADGLGLRFESHLIDCLTPDSGDALHNERKGLYLARGKRIRTIKGLLHRSASVRWEADIDGYQRKSQALKQLLKSVNGDWSEIEIED